MKRTLLAVVAAACAASSMPHTRVTAAEPCVIPKPWGRLVTAFPAMTRNGSTGYENLVFEAEDGTVRMIPADCKMPPKPTWEVTRE